MSERPKIIAIIVHYYKQRVPNLPLIVESLKDQVSEIVIYNNDEPIDPIPGARVIDSKFNHGCQGRFFAAQDCFAKDRRWDPDFFLFHDNDVITRGRAVDRLLEVGAHSFNIHAATGERRIFGDKEYFLSRAQFELMPVSTMREILAHWKNDHTSLHDDLWCSTTALKLGYEINEVRVAWKNLWDDVGFWKDAKWGGPEAFDRERQRVFVELMERKL